MKTVALGIDFGTLSARAVFVDAADGSVLASADAPYRHGVMSESLPSGESLPLEYALQLPDDYVDAMTRVVREARAALQSRVGDTVDIIGIGTDFTACTVFPVDQDGTPLVEKYPERRHAYAKLWKHHAAQDKADKINALAASRNEPFLARYGGKVSSEWTLPKIWEVLDEDPALFDEMDLWVEASDWIVWRLTGVYTRNASSAGYKGFFQDDLGYPSDSFLEALDPRLTGVFAKMGGPILPQGSAAGRLTEQMADTLGLPAGIPVAVGNIDAHVAFPAVGIGGPGEMLIIMGTSSCHIIVDEHLRIVSGMAGVVRDGVLPGFYAYEAGQASVGDMFQAFVDHFVPASYTKEAEARGLSIHQVLREKCQDQKPGQSGVLALDWWNGNRSVLVNAHLSGALLGLTLQTAPEDIYRALLEATAYGTRMIVDNYEAHGILVKRIVATGGIAAKDPLMMQIYADVLGREIRVASLAQGPAAGSAIFGTVAAGHCSIAEATGRMGHTAGTVYRPNEAERARYAELYQDYVWLHDVLGRERPDLPEKYRQLRGG